MDFDELNGEEQESSYDEREGNDEGGQENQQMSPYMQFNPYINNEIREESLEDTEAHMGYGPQTESSSDDDELSVGDETKVYSPGKNAQNQRK